MCCAGVGVVGGSRSRRVSLLLSETRHFCRFGLPGGSGDLGALCFSEPVTFVTLGCWVCRFGLLGGLLGSWGALCFSEPVTSVTLGCWRAAGELGGPFVSPNPSLLSLCNAGRLWGPLFLRTRHFCLLGLLGGCWGAGGPFGCWGCWGAGELAEPVTFCHLFGLLEGCWGAGGPLLFLRTRHFCHFGLAALLGSWGAFCFSEPVTFVTLAWRAVGELEALCFSEPVTFVTLGCWGCWAAGELAALCFSEPVTFVTLDCWGALGTWGPFVSQNPSLLSLLGAAGAAGGCWGLLGSWGGRLFRRLSLLKAADGCLSQNRHF